MDQDPQIALLRRALLERAVGLLARAGLHLADIAGKDDVAAQLAEAACSCIRAAKLLEPPEAGLGRTGAAGVAGALMIHLRNAVQGLPADDPRREAFALELEELRALLVPDPEAAA